MISVVIPVRNEHENIGTCLARLAAALEGFEHEILVCHDTEDDTTLPAVRALGAEAARVRFVQNRLGRGPSFAMRAGLAAALGDAIVVTMADLSDPPEAIPVMAEKIRRGADVVSGSRYMRGGRQLGGPPLKTFLSRGAGLSLFYLAGLGTHDATTSFRGFSRRLLSRIELESETGFTMGLEATVKAHLAGLVVDEVPVTWTDRTAGVSNFRVGSWLPAYLSWYGRAMAAPAAVWGGAGALVLGAMARGAGKLGPGLFLASVASVVLVRRKRRRMSYVDVVLPAAWLLPAIVLPSAGPAAALSGIAVTGLLWATAGADARRAAERG